MDMDVVGDINRSSSFDATHSIWPQPGITTHCVVRILGTSICAMSKNVGLGIFVNECASLLYSITIADFRQMHWPLHLPRPHCCLRAWHLHHSLLVLVVQLWLVLKH